MCLFNNLRILTPLEHNYQEHLNNLFNKYGFSALGISSFHVVETKLYYIHGQLDIDNHQILLNQEDSSILKLITVYHEFRHYWQYYYYNDVYNFWLQDNYGLYMRSQITNRYYNTIEVDARLFGYSLGTKSYDWLLHDYPATYLNNNINNLDLLGNIIRRCLQEDEEIYEIFPFRS